ncbi:glycoside hydrolase [Pluteus cervinus]|uniref:Glycoside hydrolase n=1 Tax=Pluteus cervinus TaxID=181527 RepID=A0ACD3AEQ2_9AGAR|nr:glycoside hydrolase [Pluteus cervinus]
MPRVPSTSPATGNPTPPHFIHTTSFSFVDTSGRQLFLRGVNLSGASKAPVGRPSHLSKDFWETAESGGESFVGRPLNVDDGSADVHLARLRGWGFNLLRFPVTWEALEHEGPGIYDDEFIDYIVRVLQKCKKYGFKVFMDPHQDVWSRFSGGSGAPFWTLPACGINHLSLTSTQSALLHNEYPTPSSPSPSSFPGMIWSTNYGRLLSQTLFTLFFAGRDFAPKCIINNTNIQDFLQSHFLSAFGRLAERIRDVGGLQDECVIGWDSMNEPFEGLVGWKDLNKIPNGQGSTLKKGSVPTPAQSLRLGMGIPQTCEVWDFGAFGPTKKGTVTIDPNGSTLWANKEFLGEDDNGFNERWGWTRDPTWEVGRCIWANHGVWDIETGYILRPDYFRYAPAPAPSSSPTSSSPAPPPSSSPPPGTEIEFIHDYWTPHFLSYLSLIRSFHPESILFLQPPVFAPPPSNIPLTALAGRCVYSPHYYDGLTLITKHWNWFNADALGVLRGKYGSPMLAVKIGEKSIRRSVREQLGLLKEDVVILRDAPHAESSSSSSHPATSRIPTPAHKNEYPTVIGEIGIPYDMDSKRSYGYTNNGKFRGDYEKQERAMDCSLNAADGGVGVGYTIWTYVAGDEYEGGDGWEWGDGWNGEDLSLWNVDDQRWAEWRFGVDEVDSASSSGGPTTGTAVTTTSRTGRNVFAVVDQDDLDEDDEDVGDDEDDDLDVDDDEEEKGMSVPLTPTSASKMKMGTGTGTKTKTTGAMVEVREVVPSTSGSTTTLSSSASASRGGGVYASPIALPITSTTMSGTTTRMTSTPRTTASPRTTSTPRTTSSPRTTSNANAKEPLTPIERAGYRPSFSPYEFLTFGARAYRAFVRPRPLKVVGRVIDFQFEIEGESSGGGNGGQATMRGTTRANGKMNATRANGKKVKGPVFWCVVKVGRGDVSSLGGAEGEHSGQGQGTEIFLPLVHFGSEKYLGRQRGGLKSVSSKGSVSTVVGGVGGSSSSKSIIMQEEDELDHDVETREGRGTKTTRIWPVPEDVDDLLDVEVRVSEGRWVVKGQVLEWFYDAPTSTPGSTSRSGFDDDGEGEGEKEVRIEVWRREGTIVRNRVLGGGEEEGKSERKNCHRRCTCGLSFGWSRRRWSCLTWSSYCVMVWN